MPRDLLAKPPRDLLAPPQGPVPDTDPSLAEQARTPSLQERGADIFGLDPNIVKRGTLLPIGRNAQGETELAVPQIGVDMLNSAIAPGEAAKGTPITAQDAAKFTADFLLPGTRPGNAPRGGVPRRQFVKDAPTSEALRESSRGALGQAKETGLVVTDDAFKGFVDDLGVDLGRAGANSNIHPKVTGAFQALDRNDVFALMARQRGIGDNSRTLAQGLDVDDLVMTRRQIGTALRSGDQDEVRLAGIMADKFDDFIDNLAPDQLAAGSSEGVTENLAKFRQLWARAARADAVSAVIERAANSASGVENGLRTGFRQLLKNPKRLKGFSAAEQQAMLDVVNGTKGTKALRLLGKMAFGTNAGTNFLGGSIGVAGGAQLFGAPGAVAAPLVGLASQKGAIRSTSNAADLVRAMAATGQVPAAANTSLAQRLAPGVFPTIGAAEIANPQNELIKRLMQLGSSPANTQGTAPPR